MAYRDLLLTAPTLPTRSSIWTAWAAMSPISWPWAASATARVREFILGGATDAIPQAPPCPVPMSH